MVVPPAPPALAAEAKRMVAPHAILLLAGEVEYAGTLYVVPKAWCWAKSSQRVTLDSWLQVKSWALCCPAPCKFL